MYDNRQTLDTSTTHGGPHGDLMGSFQGNPRKPTPFSTESDIDIGLLICIKTNKGNQHEENRSKDMHTNVQGLH